MIAFGLYLLKVSISLAGFYALYVIAFKNATFFQFNRFYLLFSVLAAFLIPVIQLNLFTNKYELIDLSAMNTSFGEIEYDPLLRPQQVPPSVSDFNYVQIISGGYLVGIFLLLIRFVISIVRMIHLKRNAVTEHIDNLTIVRTTLKQPFSFLKWIFIPKEQSIDPLIIEHESVHVTQYHWVDLLLIEMVSIILWFNPLMIFYRRSIKLQHEFLADAYAVEDGNHLEQYLKCLLKQIQYESKHHLVNPFYSKSIKQRISMMTKDKTPHRFSALYLLLIPVVSIMLFAFAERPVSVPVEINDTEEVVVEDHTPSISPVEMTKAKRADGYGERVHPATHKKQMHLGVDFVLQEGEPVMATADGEVIESRKDDYRGIYVIVKHDEIYTTSYSHLKDSILKAGDKVKKGQVLGHVGSTGLSAIGAHLHYEVLKSGDNVDPKDYLPR